MTLAELTKDQREFLALHIKRIVYMWQWIFGESMLRARAGTLSIAIHRDELEDLIARGLMCRGAGAADVYPTANGRALVV